MKKEVYMEDVHRIGLDAMILIKDKLRAFGIELTDIQDDEIYVPLCNILEKLTNASDYRSHN